MPRKIEPRLAASVAEMSQWFAGQLVFSIRAEKLDNPQDGFDLAHEVLDRVRGQLPNWHTEVRLSERITPGQPEATGSLACFPRMADPSDQIVRLALAEELAGAMSMPGVRCRTAVLADWAVKPLFDELARADPAPTAAERHAERVDHLDQLRRARAPLIEAHLAQGRLVRNATAFAEFHLQMPPEEALVVAHVVSGYHIDTDWDPFYKPAVERLAERDWVRVSKNWGSRDAAFPALWSKRLLREEVLRF